MTTSILTIGHSTYDIERFATLLAQHGVTALADEADQIQGERMAYRRPDSTG